MSMVMSRQKQAGALVRERTRARVLLAAEEEFAELGYVAATVARIAARAGVTVQSLYAAWGSKPALLRAHLEAVLAPGEDRVDFSGAVVPADPREVIRQIAHLFREVAERSAPAWRLYRDAAVVDPEIAAEWQQIQLLRRGTFVTLVQSIPDRDFRVARSVAADTAWAIASPEMHELLVERAGYALDAFEAWIDETIAAAILREDLVADARSRAVGDRRHPAAHGS